MFVVGRGSPPALWPIPLRSLGQRAETRTGRLGPPHDQFAVAHPSLQPECARPGRGGLRDVVAGRDPLGRGGSQPAMGSQMVSTRPRTAAQHPGTDQPIALGTLESGRQSRALNGVHLRHPSGPELRKMPRASALRPAFNSDMNIQGQTPELAPPTSPVPFISSQFVLPSNPQIPVDRKNRPCYFPRVMNLLINARGALGVVVVD